MLEIKDLKVEIKGKVILDGINLKVNKGEVHTIMGPNGSGKSTLSKAIMGHPDCSIVKGKILLDGQDIRDLEPDEIAKKGMFLGFQYPVEVPGISNEAMLREAVNQQRRQKGETELDPLDFHELIEEKLEILDMDKSFLARGVNEGFSGGEKKKNEILQMAVLSPKIAFLDETDSGLDVDALKMVCDGINKFKSKENAFVIITHYNTILKYVHPDFVHILCNGKITKTAGKELAEKIEKEGFKDHEYN